MESVSELAPLRAPTDAGIVDVLIASMLAELDERAPLVDLYEDYFEGRHKLTFLSGPYRRAFAQMLAAVSDNWVPLIISAPTERLHVQGVRAGDEIQAEAAWTIWRRNGMEEDSDLAFTEAAKHGESYLLAERDPLDPRVARLTTEHPRQFIVRRAAGDRRRLVAALKAWFDPDAGEQHVTLWTPESIHRRRRAPGDPWFSPRTDLADDRNELRRVPVGVLVNEPAMMPSYPPTALLAAPHRAPNVAVGLGRSDMADAISTVDQINVLLCDMLIAAEYAAFRQRWATGLQVPSDPDTGKPIEPFKSAVDRLWISTSPDTRFGEFGATDLANYIRAIQDRIQSLASRLRIPPHILMAGMGSFPSGESLRAAETGLVAKVVAKQRGYAPGILAGLGCACELEGVELPVAAEVDWANPESRVESEYVDSLVKKLSLGVPPQQLWEDYGYSPEQIERFARLLREASDSGLLAYLKPAPGLPAPATGDQAPQTPPTPETNNPNPED